MNYKVTIDNFEGPLDLLLHLIKEENISIYDIKLEDITRQYLDYINAMKDMNLTIASEYLVMASELVEMKSKMLLPREKQKEEDDYVEDPKEALIQRLLAYKKYKEITEDFKNLEEERKLFITKEPEDLSYYLREEENDGSVSINDLIDAINNLIKKKEKERPLSTKITKKELSVTERVVKIRGILKSKKKVNFEELFEGDITKEEIIVSFLSILEMVKNDEILIKQENNFNNIIISLKEGE